MKTFTIVAYVLPAGGHHVETLPAVDGTAAALQLREKLDLSLQEFEVVGVIAGAVEFVPVDHRQLALAPFSSASP